MRIRRKGYTDTCVVIGPSYAWTQDDYDDLSRKFPEIFLGYHVYLTTVSSVAHGDLAGVVPSKIVVLNGVEMDEEWYRVLNEIYFNEFVYGTKIEYWAVHRGRGIEKHPWI